MKDLHNNFLDLVQKLSASVSMSVPSMYCAADIMTRNIKFLTLDNTVIDFLSFMEKNKVRHVAIFDTTDENESAPFFIGIISERDVLRFSHPYASKKILISKQRKIMKKLLVQIVTRNPICVSPATSIYQIISVMIRNDIEMVPVLEDKDLVGIITTTDILCLLVTFDGSVRNLFRKLETFPSEDATDSACLRAWIERTAGDIMTGRPFCLGQKDTVEKAIALLKEKGFRHILITDKNKRLIGVVSDRDILRHLPYAKIRSQPKPKNFREDSFSVPPETLELEAPLAHVMEWDLVSITDDLSVAEAAKKILSAKLSCLPVLNSEEDLTGIITVRDLMKVLLNACKPVADQ